jgi:hypothetical protein
LGQKKVGLKKTFFFFSRILIFLGGFVENLILRRISLSNPMRSGEHHIEKIEKLSEIFHFLRCHLSGAEENFFLFSFLALFLWGNYRELNSASNGTEYV